MKSILSKHTRRSFLKNTSLAATGLFLLSPLSILAKALSKEHTMPLAERLKRNIVPKRGFCSTGIEGGKLFSGNGKMRVEIAGYPLSDEIVFFRENMTEPWNESIQTPDIAHALPRVRKMMLEGKYREALQYSLDEAEKAGMGPGTQYPHGVIPMQLQINIPENGTPREYLRTLDYESGEIKVFWTDNRGEWIRRTFASRPDNVIAQLISAPKGQMFCSTIDILSGLGSSDADATFVHESKGDTAFVIGKFKPDAGTGNEGFASAIRVISNGGEIEVGKDSIKVKNAKSVLLLVRTDRYKDFKTALVDKLAKSLDDISANYETLLSRNRKVQSEVMGRCTVDFGGKKQFGMSSEELFISQKLQDGYAPALLEQLFDMGRYWLYSDGTGDYPAIRGHININLNLQISSAAMGAIPEAIAAWVKWIEEITPDSRNNARNFFGARGTLFSAHPDSSTGVLYHFDFNWPHHYWISGGGWIYSPVWDYYLVTGDKDFLKKHIEPGLKELAWFYEDYLTQFDENGKYIFSPSYSPENYPSNSDKTMSVINSVMDIAVCKEVLTHLIEASVTLGINANDIPKWKAMLGKMPPYLFDTDGAIKEWAWPTLKERQDHRHPSHLYPVWPTDEATPEKTSELSKAIWIANRKRAHGNSSGHGFSYRAIAAARSKDARLVDWQLRQLLEMAYFTPTLRSVHNPYYSDFMPDQTGALPTILLEMLFYSRPGVMEILPALPASLKKGSINGLLARTFAKVEKMSWDLDRKYVELTISSLKDQDVDLFVRQGIKSISVSDGALIKEPQNDDISCNLRLKEGRSVTIKVGLGEHSPSDWIRNL